MLYLIINKNLVTNMHTISKNTITVIVITIVSAWLCTLFKGIALRFGLIAMPNHRSSHKYPTAIAGGLIFGLLILITAMAHLRMLPLIYKPLILSCSIMLLTGLLDDFLNLSIKLRLLLQTLSALLILHSLGAVEGFGFLSYPLTLLGIIWAINVFNFMDGIDGLATTQAIVICIMTIFACVHSSEPALAKYLFIVLACLLGFLTKNFPPANLFMGNTGSYFLGTLLVGIMIMLHKLHVCHLVNSLMVSSLFWTDTTITLIRRIIKVKDWYNGHCQHAFQRAQTLGWQHKKILTIYTGMYILQLTLGIISILHQPCRFVNLAISTGIAISFYLYIEKRAAMQF